MTQRILITGGAGFIGSHVADELLRHGYRVRVFDSLLGQVHGDGGHWPAYLDRRVELIRGEIREIQAVKQALRGVDGVVHLASMVGVGQSMYQIRDYTSANALGTATLMQALADHPVKRLVTASSMSVYGEGRYRDSSGQLVDNATRSLESLKNGQWDPADAQGQPLTPEPTPESKQTRLASVYALSKYEQEQMCLIVGRAYGIETVALRFFNTYGPRQALSNPYTGVMAIFASRLLNNKPPIIFEDGNQQRDFVSVHDVAQACRLSLETPAIDQAVLNVGSGRSITIRELAQRLAQVMGKPEIEPTVSGEYRVGDIRHCYADITAAREALGYEPRVGMDEGVAELARWLKDQKASDHVEAAHAELSNRGLTV